MLVLYIDIKPSMVYRKEELRDFPIQQGEVFPLISKMEYRIVQNVKKVRFLKKKKNSSRIPIRAFYVTQTFNKYLLRAYYEPSTVPGIVHTLDSPCLHRTSSLVEETDNKQKIRIISCDSLFRMKRTNLE